MDEVFNVFQQYSHVQFSKKLFTLVDFDDPSQFISLALVALCVLIRLENLEVLNYFSRSTTIFSHLISVNVPYTYLN
jgi:hypothetical protein